MAPPLRSRRTPRIVAALVVLIGAGTLAYGRIERRNMSPFVFWQFRPGMSFEALEKSAYRQTKRRFTCSDVAGPARLCEMRVSGIAGNVRVLVDARGRAAVVQFLPDSATVEMREEGRRIAAEWNLVRRGEADRRDPPNPKRSVTRWRSENGKYAAMMQYRPPTTTPAIVEVTDVRSLTGVAKSTPLASLILSLNDLLESDSTGEREVQNVFAAVLFGRPTDPAYETDAPRAPAGLLARCKGENPDPVVARTNRDAMFEPPTARLLELAIPAAYPGSRLVLGDGAWLVDSAGRAERMQFARGEFTTGDGFVTFGITFPGRVAVANQRLLDAVPDRYCRAPAELLFARRNDDGSLAEAHLVPVDHEAVFSEIVSISASSPDLTGEPPYLRVRYSSMHAIDRSLGAIDWEAIIRDDPPRTARRVPLMFKRYERESGLLSQGFLIITARPAGGIEVSTVEEHNRVHSTRTIVVPIDSSGVLVAPRVLERLFTPKTRR